MRKKIVMYFHKRKLEKDPFSSFGIKKSVYHDFFKRGLERGFEMYVASGQENYIAPLTFKNAYRYNGNFFEPCSELITMDAVFDRSGGMSFPTEDISRKVLNNIDFKKLCNNKNETQKLIGDFMPKSIKIKPNSDIANQIASFPKSRLAVLKPAKGMCGKGIIIDYPEKIAQKPNEKNQEYILQEFVDTSGGISGIISGHHDLRVIIVNGKITLSHVRTPANGSLLANVAQGGSIKEVPLEDIPAFIIDTVQKIKAIVDKKFNYPIYSIDLGIQNNNEPFVFELNDQIGFPSEQMKGSAVFIENALDSLERIIHS